MITTDALNRVTTFGYDADAIPTSTPDVLSYTTPHSYVEHNVRTLTTFEDNSTKSTKYNDALLKETTISYEELGNKFSKSDGTNSSSYVNNPNQPAL